MHHSHRQKGGRLSRTHEVGQGNEVDGGVDGQCIPVASRLASASPAEVKLIEGTLDRSKVDFPFNLKLVLDCAYDSDPLRYRLRERWIQIIVRTGNENTLKTVDPFADKSDVGRLKEPSLGSAGSED